MERLKLLPAKDGLAYRPQEKLFPVVVLVVSKPGVQTMASTKKSTKSKEDSCFREEDKEGEHTIMQDIAQKDNNLNLLGL